MDVLPGPKKVVAITRWSYKRGGRKAGFHFTSKPPLYLPKFHSFHLQDALTRGSSLPFKNDHLFFQIILLALGLVSPFTSRPKNCGTKIKLVVFAEDDDKH